MTRLSTNHDTHARTKSTPQPSTCMYLVTPNCAHTSSSVNAPILVHTDMIANGRISYKIALAVYAHVMKNSDAPMMYPHLMAGGFFPMFGSSSTKLPSIAAGTMVISVAKIPDAMECASCDAVSMSKRRVHPSLRFAEMRDVEEKGTGVLAAESMVGLRLSVKSALVALPAVGEEGRAGALGLSGVVVVDDDDDDDDEEPFAEVRAAADFGSTSCRIVHVNAEAAISSAA